MPSSLVDLWKRRHELLREHWFFCSRQKFVANVRISSLPCKAETIRRYRNAALSRKPSWKMPFLTCRVSGDAVYKDLSVRIRSFVKSHDGSNFRRGPPTPQARKSSKIYDYFSTPLPLNIQNLQFLWILQYFVAISWNSDKFSSKSIRKFQTRRILVGK